MRFGSNVAMWLGTTLASASGFAFAQSPAPPIAGTWTGTAMQNDGASNYTAILTLTKAGGQTDYPELKCGGILKRVGIANGYVFFTETITRGGKASGGSCIDGTATVAPAGAGLSWGWMGTANGKVYVAWSNMTRK